MIRILLIFAVINSLLLLVTSQGSPQLVYVQQVFRHGARYPLFINEEDNSTYAREEDKVGELTKQGKSMHYVLGNYLFKEYWDRLFGGVRELNQSKFYVKSTNVNRTIESVQSQLLGLFENINPLEITQSEVPYSMPTWTGIPPRKAGLVFPNSPQFQPLPVHVQKGNMSPWDRGDFLRIYSESICYKQGDWIVENRVKPKILDMIRHPRIVAAHEALNKQVGRNVSFWDLYKFIDSAACQKYAGRKLLPIMEENSEHRKTFDFLFMFDMLSKLYLTEKQLAATATGYFNHTLHEFKRIEKDTSGVQWGFYSAHDTTLGNFITRLNLTNVDCVYDNFNKGKFLNNQSSNCILEYPNYASTLIFEVHKYLNGTHVMRVRWNGLYRTIPFCGHQNECPLDQFYAWYESWKDENFEETCGIVDSYKDQASVYFSLMVIFLALVLCLAIYYIVKRLEEGQKEMGKPPSESKRQVSNHAQLMQQSLLQNEEVEKEY